MERALSDFPGVSGGLTLPLSGVFSVGVSLTLSGALAGVGFGLVLPLAMVSTAFLTTAGLSGASAGLACAFSSLMRQLCTHRGQSGRP